MFLECSVDCEEFPVSRYAASPHVPVLQAVWERLIGDPRYRQSFHNLDCHFSEGRLTLLGRVPTFHLKQLLQTMLRDIDGVRRIDNQVAVTGGEVVGR